MKVILASTSPRRKDILRGLGVDFDVVSPDCEEFTDKTQPAEVVKDLALQKAKNVAERVETGKPFIIAADTLVWSCCW